MQSLRLRCFAVAAVILSVLTGCTSVGQPAGTSPAAAVTASSAAGSASPSTEASPSAKPSPSATPIPSLASTTELAAKAPAGTIVDVSADGPVVACGEGGLVLEEIQTEAGELAVGARLG